MAIDFTFSPEVEAVRERVREFLRAHLVPRETEALWEKGSRRRGQA